MQPRDVWIMLGIALLIGFATYTVYVGSNYDSPETPLERLLNLISGAADVPASKTETPPQPVIAPVAPNLAGASAPEPAAPEAASSPSANEKTAMPAAAGKESVF